MNLSITARSLFFGSLLYRQREMLVTMKEFAIDLTFPGIFFFHNSFVPLGFLPWEIRVVSPGDS